MTIEEVLEVTNQMEQIDGDNVYILDSGMKNEIEKLRKMLILEKENYMFSMLSKDLEFICSHVGFAIAFRPIKWKNIKKWVPCMIYKYEDEWKRVALQYANCLECDWCGCIANPTDPDLYITLDNHHKIFLSFCS